jgi:hypothetical protein
MTAQRVDTIIINSSEYGIHELPLEQYWEQNHNRPPVFSLETSLNRGYYAKWQIQKGKLFLIGFYGESWFPYEVYGLSAIFPTADEKIFADWYTGNISIPGGRLVNYHHAGRGAEYEYTTTMSIASGIVVDAGGFVLD